MSPCQSMRVWSAVSMVPVLITSVDTPVLFDSCRSGSAPQRSSPFPPLETGLATGQGWHVRVACRSLSSALRRGEA